MRNKLRNLYTRFARPCIKCEHNLEGNHCALTSNHEQCVECPLYASWVSLRKSAYDINMPLELENHASEINNQPCQEIDYDAAMKKLLPLLKEELGDKIYQAFYMLYFEHRKDKEIAEFLELQAQPQNSVLKQMEELKTWLFSQVTKTVRTLDLPELWR